MDKSKKLNHLLKILFRQLPEILSEHDLVKYRLFGSVAALREARRSGFGPHYGEDSKAKKFYSKESILDFLQDVYKEHGIIHYNYPEDCSRKANQP